MNPVEFVFPALAFREGPQHVMCTPKNKVELLASAYAWAQMREVLTHSVEVDEFAWTLASTAMRHAEHVLCQSDTGERQAILDLALQALQGVPSFKAAWAQLPEAPATREDV